MNILFASCLPLIIGPAPYELPVSRVTSRAWLNIAGNHSQLGCRVVQIDLDVVIGFKNFVLSSYKSGIQGRLYSI